MKIILDHLLTLISVSKLKVNKKNNLKIIIMLKLRIKAIKMRSKELAEIIGITKANLSILKSGKAKAIRFSTLEAICNALDCQPSDILEYIND